MAKAKAKSRKRVKKGGAGKKQKKVDPIPKGFHTISPGLVARNAIEALDFYKRAFGAKERSRHYMPDGKTLMHAELQLGDSVFMLSEEFPNMKTLSPQTIGGTAVSMYTYVKDVDKAFEQAVSAGGSVATPVSDMFWGDRMGQLIDPYGHVWTLATRRRNLSRQEMERAAQEWAANMPGTTMAQQQ
jgi:PhnB protein